MIKNPKYKLKNVRGNPLRSFSAWALLSCASMLTGCAGDQQIPMLTIEGVSFYADLDANLNSAIPVDMVLVYDAEVNKMISSLSASKYYQNASQLQRDNPTALDVWHWELVPGQSVVNFAVDQTRGDAYDGYIFANYLTPGDHRMKISPDGNVKVLLTKEKMRDMNTLNVQNVTTGVTAPAPQNQPSKASQQAQQQKTQKISRSTAEFSDFDTRAKGDSPGSGMVPPYVFQVEGTPNTGDTGPVDLRPEDSKKGYGDTALLNQELSKGQGGSQTSSQGPSSGDSALKPLQPCDTAATATKKSEKDEGVIWETMPPHGPDTITHTHAHPHQITKTEADGSTTTHQIIHSHEHGHPHPLVGGENTVFEATKLAPPEGVNH